MPRKPSSLSFRMTGNTLTICRKDVPEYRITLWPRPYAERSDSKAGWDRFYPEFRIVGYPPSSPKKKAGTQLELGLDVPVAKQASSKKEAYDQLRRTVPFSYGIALAPFKSHQWNPLVFLSMNRTFYDLLKSSPLLAYLLANDDRVRFMVFRRELALKDLCGMKQAELLDLLGLPSDKSTARIFRKITPASACPLLTPLLRQCLGNPDVVKRLSHLKKANLGVLTLLSPEAEMRRILTPQLLEEVSHNRSEAYYATTAHQLTEAYEWHLDLRQGVPFPRLRSRERAQAYHEELSAEVQEYLRATGATANHARLRELRRTIDRPFRNLPVPGTDTIKPLRTLRQLITEGIAQHNCVGSYGDRVRRGKCYLYSVRSPERATLSIVKSASGEWRISELRSAFNESVNPETRAAVTAWLSQTRIGA